jgi:hypothetical protein
LKKSPKIMREKSTSGFAVRNPRVMFQALSVFQRLFMLPKNPTVNQQVLRVRMGGVGNTVHGKKMTLRRSETKSEQKEKLENEQHGSTEQKTNF